MKKLSLLYTIVVLATLAVVLYSSCKKIVHPYAPTPSNIRLHSYTATTQTNQGSPNVQTDTINYNYTFSYDDANRVTQILYTSDDFHSPDSQQSQIITFTYSGLNVYKKIVTLNQYNYPVEYDTFILASDNSGLITDAYEPNHHTNYQYYGQLLERKTEEYSHTGPFGPPFGSGTVTATTKISDGNGRRYTSNNGDFLSYTFEGPLIVTYPSQMNIGTYPMREYVVYPTLNGSTPFYYTISPNAYYYYTQQGGATSTTQQISGYSEWPVLAFAVDTSNDTAWVAYPGNNAYTTESYTFYTNLDNRVGDYLQLMSFTKYGTNVYRNNHLLQGIKNSGYTTFVNYNIDANSEISQMTVRVTDSVANTKTTVYNLQYEKF